jgi:hypothetical protein
LPPMKIVRFITHPFFIFCIGFIVTGQVLNAYLGKEITKCRDGWHSPSIGAQGACSHHDGVDRSLTWRSVLKLVVAGASAYAVVVFRNPSQPNVHPNLPSPISPPSIPVTSSQAPTAPRIDFGKSRLAAIRKTSPETPKCLECNASTQLRYNKEKNGLVTFFWGCSNYPDCEGFMSLRFAQLLKEGQEMHSAHLAKQQSLKNKMTSS